MTALICLILFVALPAILGAVVADIRYHRYQTQNHRTGSWLPAWFWIHLGALRPAGVGR